MNLALSGDLLRVTLTRSCAGVDKWTVGILSVGGDANVFSNFYGSCLRTGTPLPCLPTVSLLQENLLSLREAALRIPGRVPGKHIDVSQLHRWSSRGLKGVVLETVCLGQKLTSLEALERFAMAVSGHNSVPNDLPDESGNGPRQSSRKSAAIRAGEELDLLL